MIASGDRSVATLSKFVWRMKQADAVGITSAIHHNKWNHLPCFAHTLNLIVTNSLRDVPEVEALLQYCKQNVSFFHKSTKATDKLASIQSCLNIDNHKLM